MLFSATPAPTGLYDPSFEHDACGVAAIVDIAGRRSHRTVADGITALGNLDHRGAAGADPAVGDGAGILIQVPDTMLRAVTSFPLPERDPAGEPGEAYAVGMAFLPADETQRAGARALIEKILAEEHIEVLGWRKVPTEPIRSGVGRAALEVMPAFEQLFVAAPAGLAEGAASAGGIRSAGSAGGARSADSAGGIRSARSAGGARSAGSAGGARSAYSAGGARPQGLSLDRLIYPARKRIEHAGAAQGVGIYFTSLSSRTLVYKGMLTTGQLGPFFPDLSDERMDSAIAVVHSRFSTNTFPAWPLAHPYRFIAHNGEINTVRGNRNRMRAREALLASDLIPGDLARACSRSARPTRPTPPRSTRCSNCCTWPGGHCRTRC